MTKTIILSEEYEYLDPNDVKTGDAFNRESHEVYIVTETDTGFQLTDVADGQSYSGEHSSIEELMEKAGTAFIKIEKLEVKFTL